MGKLLKGEKGACLKCEHMKIFGSECTCRANTSYNATGKQLGQSIKNMDHPWRRIDVIEKGYSRAVQKAAYCITSAEILRAKLEYIETHVNPSWCPKRKAQE